MIGPQRQPLSLPQIAAQTKQARNDMTELTESDWLHIEMAASGCIGGTSDEWPGLRAAIEKITGRPFGHRKTAAWLQGFCEGVMVQAGHKTG